jgi:hypothetical protein
MPPPPRRSRSQLNYCPELEAGRGKVRGARAQQSPFDLVALQVHRRGGFNQLESSSPRPDKLTPFETGLMIESAISCIPRLEIGLDIFVPDRFGLGAHLQ